MNSLNKSVTFGLLILTMEGSSTSDRTHIPKRFKAGRRLIGPFCRAAKAADINNSLIIKYRNKIRHLYCYRPPKFRHVPCACVSGALCP